MKAKFTFLVALFLLATSIYALEPALNKRSKLAASFLKNRLERTEKNIERNPFQRKMVFQNQANSLKSAQAIKQRLDGFSGQEWDEISGQWVTEYKVEFTYDANWNMIQDLDYELDETTGQLTLYWKYDYSYDARGNMTQIIVYGGWEDDNETIHLPVTVSHYYATYSYDANGNKTQDFGYIWDKISNQFITEHKYFYTYDVSGNMTQKIESYLYADQSEYKTKTEYKYNNNGKLTLMTSFDFSENTNDWSKRNVEEYTYDSNGNKKLVVLTESTGSNNGVEQVVTFNKEEYTYDTKGNNTLILKMRHLGSNAGIEQYGYEKDEYTYDDNGHVTQYLNSSTDYNGVWVFSGKDNGANSYDDKGNLIQAVYYSWDEKTNKLIDDYREDYAYDTKYTTNDLIVPYNEDWEFVSANNMMTEIIAYYWNNDNNSWELDYKTSLAYSPVNVTSVNQLNSGISNVYPNPFSESVSFNLPDSYSQITFELFDLQGRKLLSKAIGSNEKINMEGFRSGMYLYKLNVDGKLQSGKLVKK